MLSLWIFLSNTVALIRCQGCDLKVSHNDRWHFWVFIRNVISTLFLSKILFNMTFTRQSIPPQSFLLRTGTSSIAFVTEKKTALGSTSNFRSAMGETLPFVNARFLFISLEKLFYANSSIFFSMISWHSPNSCKKNSITQISSAATICYCEKNKQQIKKKNRGHYNRIIVWLACLATAFYPNILELEVAKGN